MGGDEIQHEDSAFNNNNVSMIVVVMEIREVYDANLCPGIL